MYLAARSRSSMDGCVIPNPSMNISAKYRSSFIRVWTYRIGSTFRYREPRSISFTTSSVVSTACARNA